MLMQKVKGPAYSLVGHLPVDERGYDKAMEILMSKYGDENVVVRHFSNKIVDAPNANTPCRNCKLLVNTLNQSVAQLESHGKEVEALVPNSGTENLATPGPERTLPELQEHQLPPST